MKKNLVGLIAIIFFLIIGYSGYRSYEQASVQQRVYAVTSEFNQRGIDKDLTEKVMEFKEITNGYVIDAEGTAKAVIQFKKGTTDKTQIKISEKIRKWLTEKYPGKNINVIMTSE